MVLNRLKMFHVAHYCSSSELFIFCMYEGKRQIGMRSYVPKGQFHNWEFPLLFEGYLDNGDLVYVNAVQYMCVNGDERIMITYLHNNQQICATADCPENLCIYVTDPRLYRTPAGKILYGEN